MKHYIHKGIISEEYVNFIIDRIYDPDNFSPNYYLTKSYAYKLSVGFTKAGTPCVYINRCAIDRYLNCTENWERCSSCIFYWLSDSKFHYAPECGHRRSEQTTACKR